MQGQTILFRPWRNKSSSKPISAGRPLAPKIWHRFPISPIFVLKSWAKFPGAIAKKSYRAGEFIFHEGEHGTTACYILSGEVEVFLKSPIVAVENKKRRGWFGSLGKLPQYVKGTPAKRGGEKVAT